MNTKAMDLDAATDAELEAYLASNLEGMREPCPYDAEGVAYTFRYHIERPSTCPKCHGLGYVPKRGLEAVLDAMDNAGWVCRITAWNYRGTKVVEFWRSELATGFLQAKVSEQGDLYKALLRAAAKAVAAREALIAAEEPKAG